jgi:hypothetical protein
MAGRFQLAASGSTKETVAFRLGSWQVKLEFAGDELRAPLARFIVDQNNRMESADFTLRIWDTSSTGIAPPPPGLGPTAAGARPSASAPLKVAHCAVSSTLQVFAGRAPVAYYWAQGAHTLKSWELAAPFRTVLSWWLETQNAALAHAAVVGRAKRGVLVVGPSGAGKSTTALACLNAGMQFLSDDCALLTYDNRFRARGVYRTAKLRRSFLTRTLPGLCMLDTGLRHDRDKTILALPETSDRLLQSCEIVAIVVQARTHATSSVLKPTTPARALSALAPSTLLQTPGLGQCTLDFLANGVRSTPCFLLQAGSNLGEVVARIEGLLA